MFQRAGGVNIQTQNDDGAAQERFVYFNQRYCVLRRNCQETLCHKASVCVEESSSAASVPEMRLVNKKIARLGAQMIVLERSFMVYASICWLHRLAFDLHLVLAASIFSRHKMNQTNGSAKLQRRTRSSYSISHDLKAAQKDLRKRGKVLASKKSSRTAAEGMLAVAQNDGKVAVIELNCETDFVARNDIFQYLALAMAKRALLVEDSSQPFSGVFPFGPELLEELKLNLDHPKVNGETTVSNAVTEVAAIMGENVRFRRGFLLSKPSAGVLSAYLHTSPQTGLGRIAGIVSLEVDGDNTQLEAIQRVGSEIAMHVVAAKPLFLSKDLVSSEALANER
ncbi:unnamed protein product [Brassica rapa subsp. trilocularis]